MIRRLIELEVALVLAGVLAAGYLYVHGEVWK